jgi:hypothetical protein
MDGETIINQGVIVADVTGGAPERKAANAKLIVDRVNAHDDMLQALEAAKALLANLFKSVKWGDTVGLDIAALNTTPGLIERAIQKAKGGQ